MGVQLSNNPITYCFYKTNKSTKKNQPTTKNSKKPIIFTKKLKKDSQHENQLDLMRSQNNSQYFNKSINLFVGRIKKDIVIRNFNTKEKLINVYFPAQKGERLIFIWIEKDIKFYIFIEGSWSIGNKFGFCNCDGYSNIEKFNNLNCASLVGRIYPKKEVFLIESSKNEYVSDVSGVLVLSMNLSKEIINNNELKFEGHLNIMFQNVYKIDSYEEIEYRLGKQFFSNNDNEYYIEMTAFENQIIAEINKLRKDPIQFGFLYLNGCTGLSFLPNKREVKIEQRKGFLKKGGVQNLEVREEFEKENHRKEGRMMLLETKNKVLNKYKNIYPHLCNIEIEEFSDNDNLSNEELSNESFETTNDYKYYILNKNPHENILYMDEMFINLINSKYNYPIFQISPVLVSYAKLHAKDLSDSGRISFKSNKKISQQERITRTGKVIKGLIEIIHCFENEEIPLSLVVNLFISYDVLLNKYISDCLLSKSSCLIGVGTENHNFKGNIMVLVIAESIDYL